MGGKSSQTIGYKYYMSLLSGLCRGPIDELREIKAGGVSAWRGHACDNALRFIDEPNLFGGEKKEGGIEGPFRVLMGRPDQVLATAGQSTVGYLPDVKESIGGYVSDFRGTTCLWFDGMISAMNPYVKEWTFRVRRSKKGWFRDLPWYQEKATIYLGASYLKITNSANGISTDFYGSNGKIVVTAQPNNDDTFTVNGKTFTFTDDGGGLDEINNTSDLDTLAGRIRARLDYEAGSLGVNVAGEGREILIGVTTNAGAIHAMNGSHIIYECTTNPEWGRGMDKDELDENSFVAAANTLCAEGFGICLIWYRKEEIKVFIQKVCDLIGAVYYTDRETGLQVLKLIRNDYVAAALPLFSPSTGLLDIQEDDTASSTNAVNEVIGTGKDPITNQEFQVRAQNLASFQSQGSINSLDQDYRGIPTKDLLARVVTRDLRANAAGLKRYTIVLDRRGWRITPGMPFKISDPRKGIQEVIVRAAEIDDGNMIDGRITLKVTQDVFGLPATTYIQPTEGTWSPPSKVAVPAAEERLIELSYRDMVQRIGDAQAQAIQEGESYIGAVAVAPNSVSYQYDLATRADGETAFVDRGSGSFTGYARLAGNVGALDTEFTVAEMTSFDAANIGQALLIGDELVRLDEIDGTTITVTRGVGDTLPAKHTTGQRLWTIDDDITSDDRPYSEGETAFAKVLTLTSSDRLKPEDAVGLSVVLNGRVRRPYPPARVEVDGQSIFAQEGDHAAPVLTWKTRNRITQSDTLVGYVEDSVAPEEGTTYTVRVYDTADNLLREVEDIAKPTFTYTAEMIAEDTPTSTVRFELETVRDGLVSWQRHSFTVALHNGFSYDFGFNFGG